MSTSSLSAVGGQRGAKLPLDRPLFATAIASSKTRSATASSWVSEQARCVFASSPSNNKVARMLRGARR